MGLRGSLPGNSREAARAGTPAGSGLTKLRPRDSNPDYLVQSEACCHYTRPQSETEGYRR
jgi:hypothetical protein